MTLLHDTTGTAELARRLRANPALRAKAGIRLVSEVLGAASWVNGPGDDGAVMDGGAEADRVGRSVRRGAAPGFRGQ